MPRLVVIQGPALGLEYPIKGDLVVGRDPRNQIVLPHREVSGQHARLHQVGDKYFLEDLGSRNGTFVAGQPIQRHPLRDADEVTIGRTTFRFDLRSPAETLSVRRTDPGSLTVELDAARDVLKFGEANASSAKRLEQILRQLCDVSRSIGASTGLKSTLDEVAGVLLEIFPQCGRVMVLLRVDEVSLEPVVTRWRREPDTPFVQYSDTIVRKALSERRAILTIDALSDDRFSASRSVVDLRLRSLMCAPLLHRGEVLGVVELDTLQGARMFTEADLNLLTSVGSQLAFAVANAQLHDTLRGMVDATITSFTTALSMRAPALRSHAERVTRVALMIGRRLEMGNAELETLRQACLLHDIGLLSLSDAQLMGMGEIPGWLDYLEDSQDPAVLDLHRHVEEGARLLGPLRLLAGAVELIQGHHERFDGRGYPRGLQGEDIPLGARVLAVADAFDGAQQLEQAGRGQAAIEVLRSGSGTRFDPQLVTLFEKLWEARLRLQARRDGE